MRSGNIETVFWATVQDSDDDNIVTTYSCIDESSLLIKVQQTFNLTKSVKCAYHSDKLYSKILEKPNAHTLFVINDIKLRYLCRNKLPRIIFVLMHSDDYVINASSIRPRVQRWLMGKCCKRSSRIVVGRSLGLRRKVDDQTIVHNCKISRTKIGSVESVNGSFPG